MIQTISLRLLPHQAADENTIKEYAAQSLLQQPGAITGFHILKQSIDARTKTIWINLTITAFINEPFHKRDFHKIIFPHVHHSKFTVAIIGAGPAGLFAALKCIEAGIKPIIIERGKNVRARRRDLAILNKEGIINPESNYCFGEGGAGTYSDGKLYTRSTKRGDVNRILNLLVQFGADEKILYQSHPHIGTNKLPDIITAIREQIIESGGEVLFEQKLTDIILQQDAAVAIKINDEHILKAHAVILATGHSARDIFKLLHAKNILIEAKPFALGVRVEHPQSLIDAAQYHCSMHSKRSQFLPPSSYSLVQQVNGKGVFSFCMCPGGIIAAAATNANELVVNGWSPSKRNNPFANSGIVVQVQLNDVFQNTNNTIKNDALALMHFQQMVEQKAFNAGGGKFVAPAVRMVDFCNNKISASLPPCSYIPGVNIANLKEVLPAFIHKGLQQGFQMFGKKMHGYYTNDAIIVATESRTSSPVRIPRTENLHHPQIKNLNPCGEGAGYAGGIVSAAMDGERVAAVIAASLK